MKTEVVPMTKARKSVREVMVMPIPALARALPKIFGTCWTVCSWTSLGRFSLQEDINRNMSSTPIPETPEESVRVRSTTRVRVFRKRKENMVIMNNSKHDEFPQNNKTTMAGRC